MWRKHRSVFQYHLKYIRNYIVNPFCVVICRYSDRVKDMHDLAKHIFPPAVKGNIFEADSWKVSDKEFSEHEIQVDIKNGLLSSIQDELEDNQEDYRSLTHECWCDLLSKIEVKDNRKMASTQIKNIAYSIVASHSYSNESVRVPRKKKARTGVLRHKQG